MKSSVTICLFLAAPVAAQTVVPPLNAHYSVRVVGPIASQFGGYGGITLKHNDPNVLLYAPYPATTIYAVPVTRDAMGHIESFGTATVHATLSSGADGGLAYGPNNVLFHTSYPNNLVGQILPGSASTNRTLDLTQLSGGTMSGSVGGCTFVPPGYPGAGQFKVISWSTGDWRSVGLTPEPGGTFAGTSISGPLLLGGGPEGIVYPSNGSTAWPDHTRVLVADWNDGKVRAYTVDSNGDPILGTDVVVIDNVPSVGGGTVDPLTGDVLFTYGAYLAQLRQGGTCGNFRIYGQGSPGLNGIPAIAASGCARLAGSFQVDLTSGRPSSPSALLIGFYESFVPIFNFAMLNEAAIPLTVTLSPSGTYSLPVPVPAQSLFGNSDLYFQYVVFDPAAPASFSSSRGLHVHID
jgi:hypothetical protein